MTAVEMLAPLRLETRFSAQESDWVLHLRVYPDDVSLPRPVPPPTGAELDVLADALTAPTPEAAFRAAASGLGARRAWWLWRSATTEVLDGAGAAVRVVDRTGAVPAALPVPRPEGLPDQLDVWLVFADGSRTLGATLVLDAAAIAADLDLTDLQTTDGRLPARWWLDIGRARDVGLAVDVPVAGAGLQGIDELVAVVVAGTGSVPSVDLLRAHQRSGRLGVLAQGTPTNTVAGEPAADLGEDPATWAGLLATRAADQPATTLLLGTAGGAGPTDGDLPCPGGDLDHLGLGQLVVGALWPVLWGRTLRDSVGAGDREPQLATWAAAHLAVQGPLPAVRVGDQPYGILPTSAFTEWVGDPAGDPDEVAMARDVLTWAVPWRTDASASAAAVAAPGAPAGTSPSVAADARRRLTLLGMHAPSQHWRVRPVLDLPTLQALQVQQGAPLTMLSDVDRAAASAWRGFPWPRDPLAAAGTGRALPDPPVADHDDPGQLAELATLHPEPLYYGDFRLGLLGHLVREAVIIARATVGRAAEAINAGQWIYPGAPVPLDDEFPTRVMWGGDESLDLVAGSGPDGELVVRRFREVQDAVLQLADRFAADPSTVLRAVRAALDTASFRVDPWLTAVASGRLAAMAADGAPFLVGAYGWVDAPRPWKPGPMLPPGPTAAGLLHTPSFAQAQVAAVLRDAAVREGAGGAAGRWQLTLTGAKVRAAEALAQRVRLGVHPVEAVGLLVEAQAGDPDVVRVLRAQFPSTPADPTAAPDPTRRTCDGLAVLDAARSGTLPAAVPAGFADAVAPVAEVLDTWGDLLLVDGVHALVTARPEAAAAAMEAAAGLGSPPDLRGIRTPRGATTVAVSCWAVLPEATAGAAPAAAGHPATVADPAFAAALPDLAFAGGHAADGAPRPDDDPQVARLAAVLGGGQDDPPAPDEATFPDLLAAMTADLTGRWQQVRARLDSAHGAAQALDPAGPETAAALLELDLQWRLRLRPEQADWTVADRRAEAVGRLQERLEVAGADAPASAAALRAAIRAMVGRPELPVLPVVERALLPALQAEAEQGHTDQVWLEIVAAVRPRLAPLEAHQLTTERPWPAGLSAPGDDPWSAVGPVRVGYGPGLVDPGPRVAVALLDSWVDSVPSRRHVTQAAFGFNAPKTRAPQAVLLAVPPDRERRLGAEQLLQVVLETRELVLARAARPSDRGGLPAATPFPVVQLGEPLDVLAGWPS